MTSHFKRTPIIDTKINPNAPRDRGDEKLKLQLSHMTTTFILMTICMVPSVVTFVAEKVKVKNRLRRRVYKKINYRVM